MTQTGILYQTFQAISKSDNYLFTYYYRFPLIDSNLFIRLSKEPKFSVSVLKIIYLNINDISYELFCLLYTKFLF